MRTYSRQDRIGHFERPPPKKRRRIEADIFDENSDPSSSSAISLQPPSSPLRESSLAMGTSSRTCTPLSSPPPSSPPTYVRRRPMFAFLKRTATTNATTSGTPLSEQSGNAARKDSQHPPLKKKVRLVQTQLDLGSDIRKACAECGMSFIPSSTEDVALHKTYHAKHTSQVNLRLSKATVDLLRSRQKMDAGETGGFIAVVARKDPWSLRRKVENLLSVVNREMAAVDIQRETLWSSVPIRRTERRDEATSPMGQKHCDRYKVLVYVKAQRCVGLCLAERISEAFSSVEANASEGLRLSEKVERGLLLGISRIWTSPGERRAGLATTLLDCATGSFLYGIKIARDKVAFSQPTESGGRLARKWFGKQWGWHVYVA